MQHCNTTPSWEDNMTKKLDPRWFPNFENRKVVDAHMGQLDLHGVSRREFLALASASAIASATGLSLGFPGVALAQANGKLAHIMMTMAMDYTVNADSGAKGAAEALGV